MKHPYTLRLSSIVILFFRSFALFSQNECFYLDGVFYDADINYAALSRMDGYPVSPQKKKSCLEKDASTRQVKISEL